MKSHQNVGASNIGEAGKKGTPCTFELLAGKFLCKKSCAVCRVTHCATSRKVACSIPDGVIGIFHWHNPSGHTMALGLTQPLIEMSTRNISWGVKAASTYGWQPYHLHVPIVLKSGILNLLEPSGTVQACNGIDLPLPLLHIIQFLCSYI